MNVHTNSIQVCGGSVDIRPFPGAGKPLLGTFRSAAFLRWLFKHIRASRSWAVLYVLAARLGSEVEDIISWQPRWISALLHLFLSPDALRSNRSTWNFSSCLVSLMVVLINIFFWSPQAALGKQRPIPGQDSCCLLLWHVNSEIIHSSLQFAHEHTGKLVIAPASSLCLGQRALVWHGYQHMY